MSHERILVVDDELPVRTVILDALAAREYRVEGAADCTEALRALERTTFDLALLDLKMPGALDGIGLLEIIRQRFPDTIVIMMTAYGTLDSAIAALRRGAYDYLTKPASIAQIVESVERGLEKRRDSMQRQQLIVSLEKALRELKLETAQSETAADPERFVQTPRLVIDRHKRLVVQNGEPLELTPTEFDMLDYLAMHSDRVVTARELIQAVQGYDLVEADARPIVRVHLQRLRQKLGDNPNQPHVILNVRGRGYRFVG